MDHLQTEGRNPSSTNLDELTAVEIVRLMNAEDARVIPAVASQAEAIARAIDVIADRLRDGGRLIYAGAGTSGRLGVLDATECPPTFNSPPGQVVGIIAGGPSALTRAVEGAEDHPEFAEQDLTALNTTAADVVVGIATSGRTPYVLAAMAWARRHGIITIGISCNSDSELIPAVDLAITPVVGPEVLSGSTRLKAGTATKLVLNTLTTGAMVRLGKTFGNLMVDLRATNNKLRIRSQRIVRQVTGVSAEEAAALLERSSGEVKTAIVAQLAGVEVEEARRRLTAGGGRVGEAVGITSPRVANRGQAPSLLLGIDGGGSHTVALLADAAGNILGRGEAGPSNLRAVGADMALRALDDAIDRAFVAAGLTRQTVGAACLGLAGADRAGEQALLRTWAERGKLCDRLELTNDGALVLGAGTPEGWGLAVIAGTGSLALGRSADGRTARAGGWGYLMGDEGSGYRITLAALEAVARAADGRGPATRLTDAMFARLHVREMQAMVPVIYGGAWDRAALAGLAPLVFVTADAGDAVAMRIVEEAAGELAKTATAVVRQLGMPPEVPLALAGGCLLASASYLERVLRMLAALGVSPQPATPVAEPARGAVRLAAASAHQ
jgi:N-acetylmuramic acid 6-phosphate etherase